MAIDSEGGTKSTRTHELERRAVDESQLATRGGKKSGEGPSVNCCIDPDDIQYGQQVCDDFSNGFQTEPMLRERN